MLKRLNKQKFSFAPSFVTILGLVLGIYALYLVMLGNVELASKCLLISAVLDGLDGKIARYLCVTSKFGSSLDSLADFLNYGVVFGFAVYSQFSQYVESNLYFACVAIYILCTALRLARFSVTEMNDAFFHGVPVTGAAFLGMLPLSIHYSFAQLDIVSIAYCSMILLLILSVLMMSQFRTISFSRIKFSQTHLLFALVLVFCGAILLWLYQWAFIIALQIAYMAIIIIQIVQTEHEKL